MYEDIEHSLQAYLFDECTPDDIKNLNERLKYIGELKRNCGGENINALFLIGPLNDATFEIAHVKPRYEDCEEEYYGRMCAYVTYWRNGDSFIVMIRGESPPTFNAIDIKNGVIKVTVNYVPDWYNFSLQVDDDLRRIESESLSKLFDLEHVKGFNPYMSQKNKYRCLPHPVISNYKLEMETQSTIELF